MSGFDLHEFNVLSKKHHYFMTNNRINGFPILKENSLFLQKILLNRNSNSCDKRLEIETSKPKKIVRFAKPETIQFKNIYQSPIRIRNKPNDSNENIYNEGFPKKVYNKNLSNSNSNKLKRINLYIKNPKMEDNKNINRHKPNYFRISINRPNKRSVSPDYYNNDSHKQSNSNIFDSGNKMNVLSFRGRKIFTSNSFYGLKSRSTSNSPEKKDNIITSQKESELFRNPEELKKKKEEILLRKMKRDSSGIKREILKNEKDKDIKDIKEQKININIITNNIKPNVNKIRIIPLNKEINNNRSTNNNKCRSNDNEEKKNLFNINIRSRNKKEFNNSLKYNNIRRIYKFNNNTNNSNEISSITKESQDSNSLNNSNNIILYPKKDNFKTKNIFISKIIGKTPPKIYNNNINNKIKQNLDFLRTSKNSKISDETNEQIIKNNIKKCSPGKIIKKKFIEDITYEAPTIYSKDKKVSIKVHILQNKNETFLGKTHTNQKLKMQRVINICFILNNKNRLKFLKNYKNISRKNDLRFLASIKEEEEKSKIETNSFVKTEPKIEIEKKPEVEKNIRRKYLRRFNNKK